jgi:hypothetical protein
MKQWKLLGSLAVAVACACGGSSKSDGGGGGVDGVALEDVPRELADATCARLLRCNPLLDAIVRQQDCGDAVERLLDNSGWDDLTEAVDDGRASYDGEAMESCLQAFEDVDCDDLDSEPAACNDAAVGTVERGEDCTVDIECERVDDFCHFDGQCPGTCSAPLSAGDECTDDDECEGSLGCSDETGRCVEPAGEGDDCDGGVAPPCADNLICIGDDDEQETAGTCMRFEEVFVGEAGDPCDIDAGPLCESGAACVIAVIDDELVSECMGLASAGEDCNLGLPNACKPGTFCMGLSLTGLLAGETGTCQPLGEDGDACDDLNPCSLLSTTCVQGECVGRRDNGVSCDADVECGSENCLDGGCAPSSACE